MIKKVPLPKKMTPTEEQASSIIRKILKNIDTNVLKDILEETIKNTESHEEIIVSSNMKIFYYYNNTFIDMKENFELSMKDNWEKCVLKMDEINEYGSVAGGYNGWLGKIRWVLKGFEKTYPDEIFVYSDTDIGFYAPAIEDIQEQMENKEILFGKENSNGGINGGFIAIRNCKNCKDLFKESEKMIQEQPKESNRNDQHVLQEILNNKTIDIKWGVLDNRFWNRSAGFDSLKKDIILHHANCVITKVDKYLQFEEVKYKLYGTS